MSNHLAHEMTDLVPLYALGVLSQHEARAFEDHLANGCEICASELPAFEQTVGALGLGEPEANPSAAVREKLVARVGRQQKQPVERSTQFLSILATDGEWQELIPGVTMKQLYVDQTTGLATSLVRMLPGTALPPHAHAGVEQLFIIEGDCRVRGEHLGPGDYHRAEAGSIHETTYTVDGTVFLLVAPEEYQLLNAG